MLDICLWMFCRIRVTSQVQLSIVYVCKVYLGGVDDRCHSQKWAEPFWEAFIGTMGNKFTHITVGEILTVFSFHSSQVKIDVCGNKLVTCGEILGSRVLSLLKSGDCIQGGPCHSWHVLFLKVSHHSCKKGIFYSSPLPPLVHAGSVEEPRKQ